MDRNLYEVLGVDPKATAEEITKAYRALAKQYHPDRNVGDDAAKAKYAEVDDAYAVLSDPHRRHLYDQTGARHRSAESIEVRVQRRLVPMFLTEIIDHGRNPKHSDILLVVKGKLLNAVEEHKRSLKDTDNKIARTKQALGRVTTPGELNPFEEGLTRILKDMDAHRARTVSDLEELEESVRYLSTCSYRTDVVGSGSGSDVTVSQERLNLISITWGTS